MKPNVRALLYLSIVVSVVLLSAGCASYCRAYDGLHHKLFEPMHTGETK